MIVLSLLTDPATLTVTAPAPSRWHRSGGLWGHRYGTAIQHGDLRSRQKYLDIRRRYFCGPHWILLGRSGRWIGGGGRQSEANRLGDRGVLHAGQRLVLGFHLSISRGSDFPGHCPVEPVKIPRGKGTTALWDAVIPDPNAGSAHRIQLRWRRGSRASGPPGGAVSGRAATPLPRVGWRTLPGHPKC
jgi:hypothetical protein